jgi:transcriptional regulator GlxA family with amidase domain
MGAFPETADRSIRIEDQFILRIREIMEKHLGDESFGIQELCNEVNMSRAQLYRKFKSLTDKTVHEYLQSFRLFKARSLLEAGELNVTEVAYDVGFKSISHFSRVFTAEFGKNPSEFRKPRDNQATF